jgi:DNA-binding PadR family transcriptional regulator
VLLLLQLLLMFRLLPCGFRSRELRVHLAHLRGQDPATYTAGQMTYQLRRLRLHGLIERQVGTHRYQVTERGLRVALFFTRSYARVIRPGLTEVFAVPLPEDSRLQQAFAQVERAMEQYSAQAKV